MHRQRNICAIWYVIEAFYKRLQTIEQRLKDHRELKAAMVKEEIRKRKQAELEKLANKSNNQDGNDEAHESAYEELSKVDEKKQAEPVNNIRQISFDNSKGAAASSSKKLLADDQQSSRRSVNEAPRKVSGSQKGAALALSPDSS